MADTPLYDPRTMRALRRMRRLTDALNRVERIQMLDRRVRRWYAQPLTWHDVYAWRSEPPESKASRRRTRELNRQLFQASVIVQQAGIDPWEVDLYNNFAPYSDEQ